MYSTDGQYHPSSKAMGIAKQAIRAGALVRPDTCELCGTTPIRIKNVPIHAHHWNGYDHPLDVWWLCKSCNGYLIGEQFHNGKTSKEEAIEFIKTKRPQECEIENRCQHLNARRKRCRHRATQGNYCLLHSTNRYQPTCRGFTPAGSPCKNRVPDSSGYCYYHRKS